MVNIFLLEELLQIGLLHWVGCCIGRASIKQKLSTKISFNGPVDVGTHSNKIVRWNMSLTCLTCDGRIIWVTRHTEDLSDSSTSHLAVFLFRPHHHIIFKPGSDIIGNHGFLQLEWACISLRSCAPPSPSLSSPFAASGMIWESYSPASSFKQTSVPCGIRTQGTVVCLSAA